MLIILLNSYHTVIKIQFLQLECSIVLVKVGDQLSDFSRITSHHSP